MSVDTSCADTAASHELIVGVLGVEARSDARLEDLVARVACLSLSLTHDILLKLQRVAVVCPTAGILLQWNLLELLWSISHAFILLAILHIRLLRFLSHRFLVGIALYVLVE